jgi:hypothetical protein
LSSSTRYTDGFCHEALFYSGGNELLAGTVPFLRDGLEAGEAILVAMPEANLDLLRANLNGESERIQFVNMEELGRNPARIIAAWRDFVGEHYREGSGVRGIGEPISAAELVGAWRPRIARIAWTVRARDGAERRTGGGC